MSLVRVVFMLTLLMVMTWPSPARGNQTGVNAVPRVALSSQRQSEWGECCTTVLIFWDQMLNHGPISIMHIFQLWDSQINFFKQTITPQQTTEVYKSTASGQYMCLFDHLCKEVVTMET